MASGLSCMRVEARKHPYGLLNLPNHQRSIKGASGPCLGRVWGFWGVSGACPELRPWHVWGASGMPWVCLGRVWGVSGVCLARVRGVGDVSGASLARLWCVWAGSGAAGVRDP